MPHSQTDRPGAHAASGPSSKYLTFFLAGQEYGLEILKVHEIIGLIPITPVPRTPDYIRGVVNLRGKVMPVIDLRRKFSMPPAHQTQESCIIIVQAEEKEVGVVVDKVSEVLDIPMGDIDEAPFFGRGVQTGYILGIAKSDGRVKLLLDIETALSAEAAPFNPAPEAAGIPSGDP